MFIEAGCDHFMFLSFDIYKEEAQKSPNQTNKQKDKNKKRESEK